MRAFKFTIFLLFLSACQTDIEFSQLDKDKNEKKYAQTQYFNGVIRGNKYIDIPFNVTAGQYLNISLASNHRSAYFNILEPQQNDEAIFIGSIKGNQFESIAKKTGQYTVRIYLIRAAATRNETASYRLELITD